MTELRERAAFWHAFAGCVDGREAHADDHLLSLRTQAKVTKLDWRSAYEQRLPMDRSYWVFADAYCLYWPS
jgi:hypothetical protein